MSVVDHSSSARITADIVRWHPFPLASKDLLQLHKYMHPGLELLETGEERKGEAVSAAEKQNASRQRWSIQNMAFKTWGLIQQQLFPPALPYFRITGGCREIFSAMLMFLSCRTSISCSERASPGCETPSSPEKKYCCHQQKGTFLPSTLALLGQVCSQGCVHLISSPVQARVCTLGHIFGKDK